MAIAPIRPATVPETYRVKGFNTQYLTTSNSASISMAAGTPCVLSSGLLSLPVSSGNVLTDANVLAALTNEPYDHTRNPASSVPIRQTKVSATLLFPDIVIEMNHYVDNTGVSNSSNATSAAMFGAQTGILITSGVYVAQPQANYTGLLYCYVCGFVDEIGTYYGRILVKPAAIYRLF